MRSSGCFSGDQKHALRSKPDNISVISGEVFAGLSLATILIRGKIVVLFETTFAIQNKEIICGDRLEPKY